MITSRALPDVRDGLKPVQRRILYAMLHDLTPRPDAKYRKCAPVVGDVIGKLPPARRLVGLRGDGAHGAGLGACGLPLVDGSGNFGSLDGDEAAAYRYTECRLAPAAMELLRELDFETVDFRPNYDGTTEEPIVLPARYPEPAHQRLDRHRRRHGDEHPAAQPARDDRDALIDARRRTASSSTSS